jgi:hypothetical protein
MKHLVRPKAVHFCDGIFSLMLPDPKRCSYATIDGFPLYVGIIAGGIVFLLSKSVPLSAALGCAATGFVAFLSSPVRRQLEYNKAVSTAYISSIKNALEADHPDCIEYILSNTLDQLKNLGITHHGQQIHLYGVAQGYPDQSKLRNAILLAQEFFAEWDSISRLAGVTGRLQALEVLKNTFRDEAVWMAGMWPECIRINEIYYFSCEDLDVGSHRLSQDPVSVRETQVKPEQHEAVKQVEALQGSTIDRTELKPRNATTVTITFEEFLSLNPYLRYLSPEEQRRHYSSFAADVSATSGQVTTEESGGDQDIW